MNPTQSRLAELHWPLVAVVFALSILGVYNIHSAAAASHAPDLYIAQTWWLALGVLVAGAMLAFDYRVTEGGAYVLYAVTCALLIAVLVGGKVAGGARRWLVMGPLTFQPSELAKIALIFCLARYFSRRSDDGGYTVRSLLRPLNPSRPLAVLVAVAMFWNEPALADPLGELARLIHRKIPSPAAPGDLLWLRGMLMLGLAGGCALAIAWVIRAERQVALLHPWPVGRRRRLIALTVILFAGLAWLLGMAWSHPVLRDPFGVLIQALHQGAAADGPYAVVSDSLGLRLVLALFAAAYMGASLWSLRWGVNIDVLIAPIDLLLMPALLVMRQPDLGTGGIVALIGLSMILVVGVRAQSLIILGLQGAAIAAIGWFGLLQDYQKRRIITFIDPEHDIKGAGWHAVQSLIAVGSGKWWGKGHMNGTQSQLSFLPEQHTDFAFSVWAEEAGFMGCMLVLVLYFLLAVFAITIAISARETYGALLAAGVAALMIWHTVINISMVIGMAPVVGVTLPLFSYGGSSLVTVMIGIGILLNVHWRRRAH